MDTSLQARIANLGSFGSASACSSACLAALQVCHLPTVWSALLLKRTVPRPRTRKRFVGRSLPIARRREVSLPHVLCPFPPPKTSKNTPSSATSSAIAAPRLRAPPSPPRRLPHLCRSSAHAGNRSRAEVGRSSQRCVKRSGGGELLCRMPEACEVYRKLRRGSGSTRGRESMGGKCNVRNPSGQHHRVDNSQAIVARLARRQACEEHREEWDSTRHDRSRGVRSVRPTVAICEGPNSHRS